MNQPKDDGSVIDARWTKLVLDDCGLALSQLKQNPTGQDWRIKWVGMLALLRTVMEVLKNVDGNRKTAHPALRKEISEFLKRLRATEPEPAIYWSLMASDTNTILHQYKFSALHTHTRTSPGSLTNTIATTSTITRTVATDSTERPTKSIGSANVGTTLVNEYLMKTGPFKGRDQRDVVQEAIDWWYTEIDELETRAAADVLKKHL